MSDPSCQVLISADRPYFALGLEGSANKLGAGIIMHGVDGSAKVLANIRHTYITPPGEGFLPRDTAQHHREWVLNVIKDTIGKAKIGMEDLDCICYTKGMSLRIAVATPITFGAISKALVWVPPYNPSHWLLERSPSYSANPS